MNTDYSSNLPLLITKYISSSLMLKICLINSEALKDTILSCGGDQSPYIRSVYKNYFAAGSATGADKVKKILMGCKFLFHLLYLQQDSERGGENKVLNEVVRTQKHHHILV